jgi:GWxTD domain-containing protein
LRNLPLITSLLAIACLTTTAAFAQEKTPQTSSAAQELRRAAALRAKEKFVHMSPYFRSWLVEDAVYIISPEERAAFLQTNSDDERREFIQQFWERRNPDPESLENSFEHEHYRRIIYANEQFGGSVDGWKTDRGRIYIMWGPPDSITLSPAGGDCFDPGSPGNPVHNAPASSTWKYRYLEGVGENIELSFVQTAAPASATENSAFTLSLNPCHLVPIGSEGTGYALFTIPTEIPEVEVPGLKSRYLEPSSWNPKPKHTDLKALLNSRAVRSQIPLRVQFDSIRATKITSVASVQVAMPSATGDGDKERGAGAAIYGRFIHTDSGKMESQFELSVFRIRDETRPNGWTELCDKSVPLPAGTYELQIAVKDATTGKFATHYSKVSAESSTQTAKSATP